MRRRSCHACSEPSCSIPPLCGRDAVARQEWAPSPLGCNCRRARSHPRRSHDTNNRAFVLHRRPSGNAAPSAMAAGVGGGGGGREKREQKKHSPRRSCTARTAVPSGRRSRQAAGSRRSRSTRPRPSSACRSCGASRPCSPSRARPSSGASRTRSARARCSSGRAAPSRTANCNVTHFYTGCPLRS